MDNWFKFYLMSGIFYSKCNRSRNLEALHRVIFPFVGFFYVLLFFNKNNRLNKLYYFSSVNLFGKLLFFFLVVGYC